MINEITTTVFTVEVPAGFEVPDGLVTVPHSRKRLSLRRDPDVVDLLTFYVPEHHTVAQVRKLVHVHLPASLHYSRPFIPSEVPA